MTEIVVIPADLDQPVTRVPMIENAESEWMTYAYDTIGTSVVEVMNIPQFGLTLWSDEEATFKEAPIANFRVASLLDVLSNGGIMFGTIIVTDINTGMNDQTLGVSPDMAAMLAMTANMVDPELTMDKVREVSPIIMENGQNVTVTDWNL